MLDGAQLSASTFGQGSAGDIIILATNRVTISGTSADGQFGSGIFTTVATPAVGNGGNINIAAGILEVFDGAGLFTAISGLGDAGNVSINAFERVTFRDSAISTASQPSAQGQAGNIDINTSSLELTNGSQLITSTSGSGDAGNVSINAFERVIFRDSTISTTSQQGSIGEAGSIVIDTNGVLALVNGSQLITSTFSAGNSGDIIINAAERVLLDGIGSDGLSSGLFTNTTPISTGRGGIVRVTVPDLRIMNGAVINARTENNRPGGNIVIAANEFTALSGGQVITTALSSGQAGTITVSADRILLSGTDATYSDRLEQFGRTVVANQGNRSGLFANTRSNSTGDGGRITVNSNNLTLEDGARISAQSQGTGMAGDIRLNVSEQLQLTDSDIVTNAPRSSGGDITVNTDESSGLIILRGDSDVTTNSRGNGGNITLQGSGIIAFDDSDILARSQDARGGNITLAPFFGANTTFESEPPFDGNDRVDVNADGSVAAGTITTPDTSFIQNSLTELPDNAIDTDNLVANSCVVRSQEQGGTFIITGAEGLPQRPGDTPLPTYPTGAVRSVPDQTDSDNEPSWQMGDPIVEPQGAYPLADGRIVLSRECS